LAGDGSHRLIGGFQARSVGENDDSCGQALWMYPCM
jgi:hypothetical protein